MEKIGKRLQILFVVLAQLVFASSIASAVGMSVSPASLSYDNVLKGGYAQSLLYLGTDTPQNLSMNFEFNGDIKEWIRIEDENNTNISSVVVSSSHPRRIKVIIEPKADTANGNYSGYLRVITDKISDPQTGIGSSIKAAFMVNIKVSITGDEIRQCSGGGISISDVEVGFPILFGLSLQNEGNVRIGPQILIDIYDKYQKSIVYSSTMPSISILPTESARVEKEILAELDENQYWAEIKVPECGFSGTLPLDILEKGGVSDKGELVRIENQAWAQTGEIIPITAVFQNKGVREVTAQFKGEIFLGEKVVKVIDTDKIDAAPGEVIKLQSFYKTGSPGQYFVRGRVVFNNKLTTEKGSVINVNQGENSLIPGGANVLWYAIILFVIIILAMMIMIKKKKQRIGKHHKNK